MGVLDWLPDEMPFKPNSTVHKCIVCGKEYMRRSRRSGRAKTCSKACSTKRKYQQHQRYRQKPEQKAKIKIYRQNWMAKHPGYRSPNQPKRTTLTVTKYQELLGELEYLRKRVAELEMK